MNAYAKYHETRRDDLMQAARTLKKAIDRTRKGQLPPRKQASPGTLAIMQDCVTNARMHNHLAIMHRTNR